MNLEPIASHVRTQSSRGAAAIRRLRADKADELAAIDRACRARMLSDGMDDCDAEPMPRGCSALWLDLGWGG